MDDVKAKQQIVEKIKAAATILVTVSDNPSVDALSAALGVTLLLDKLEKHPTAIFSGDVPPAISFLEPEKTFDTTTDSLRDFIIALDKSKADHLRYKVEGDAVRIFITPYKTTITQDDLEFSQGEVNVELVIALGVDNQDHLDKALEVHGQIFHDATIITVTAGDQTSSLGGIDWHDAQASSLSEMVAGLAEALKTDKTKSLLDAPVATALLTGIVAETDRFSNTHTTSRVMTVASQLMAAGADQQLIATKLQQTDADTTPSTDSAHDEPESPKDSLSIAHGGETLAELDKRVRGKDDEPGDSQPEPASDEPATPQNESNGDISVSHAYAVNDDEPAKGPEPAVEPALGGTLNATTEQAADDARKAAEDEKNKTILTHSYVGSPASSEVGVAEPPSTEPGHEFLGAPTLAPGSSSVNSGPVPSAGELSHSSYIVDSTEPSIPTPTASPAPSPSDLGLPMPPAVPDFSQPSPASAYAPEPTPERLGDILAPEPTPTPEPNPAQQPPTPPVSNDPPNPAQFKIPGQP
jgi:hypothetical protein